MKDELTETCVPYNDHFKFSLRFKIVLICLPGTTRVISLWLNRTCAADNTPSLKYLNDSNLVFTSGTHDSTPQMNGSY